jgi:transmembrane sensor
MTNVVEFEARASVERQAREWLIRLDGDEPLTNSEMAALRQWMDHSPLHREELTRVSTFWNQANVLTELAVSLRPAVPERINRGMRWMRAAVVATSAVLAAVVVWGWGLRDGAANGTYGTVIGRQETIALSDGSSIKLNTDSQVQVVYSDRARGIRLLRGEALFSVTPDPHRPFEVYAADNVVRAVGTAFAVHLEGTKVDVTVTKGVVDVDDVSSVPAGPRELPGRSTSSPSRLGRLKAGQTTTIGGGTDHIDVQQLAEPELLRRMAWREGYLVFSGEPLSEAVEQINRYSPVALQIADPKLASIAIGGRFKIGDLDAVLDVLHTNFGIQSHQVDERNIRLESVIAR